MKTLQPDGNDEGALPVKEQQKLMSQGLTLQGEGVFRCSYLYLGITVTWLSK
jgi:hypothetical protein